MSESLFRRLYVAALYVVKHRDPGWLKKCTDWPRPHGEGGSGQVDTYLIVSYLELTKVEKDMELGPSRETGNPRGIGPPC